MARAIWNGKVIAESERRRRWKGNVYFPESSLKREYFRPSSTTSLDPGKGQARYMNLLIDGQDNPGRGLVLPRPQAGRAQDQGICGLLAGRGSGAVARLSGTADAKARCTILMHAACRRTMGVSACRVIHLRHGPESFGDLRGAVGDRAGAVAGNCAARQARAGGVNRRPARASAAYKFFEPLQARLRRPVEQQRLSSRRRWRGGLHRDYQPPPRVTVANPPPAPVPWTLHEKISWAANLVLVILGYAGIMMAISLLKKIDRQTAYAEAAAEAAAASAQAALVECAVHHSRLRGRGS
jgi:hypothetical protein